MLTLPAEDFLCSNKSEARFKVVFYDIPTLGTNLYGLSSVAYGATDAAKYTTYNENVIYTVSPISIDVDPLSRMFGISECVIEYDLDWFRHYLINYRMIGKLVRVYIGDYNTDVANYIHYFSGFIKSDPDLDHEDKKITLTLTDIFSKLKEADCRKFVTADKFLNTHPITLIYNILSSFLGSSFINSSSFDISDSAYNTISHFVISRGGFSLSGYGKETKHIDTGPYVTQLTGFDVISSLCDLIRGTLYIDSSGKISFKLSGGSTVANLTYDDILPDTFKQIADETKTINKVIINYDKLFEDRELVSAFVGYGATQAEKKAGDYSQTLTVRNQTSIAANAVTDVSNTAFHHEYNCDWIQNCTELMTTAMAGATSLIFCGRTHALSGSNGAYPVLASQGAHLKPSSSPARPVYLRLVPYTTLLPGSKVRFYGQLNLTGVLQNRSSEVITISSDWLLGYYQTFDEYLYSSLTGVIDKLYSFNGLGATTSATTLDNYSIYSGNELNGTAVFDITILKYYANNIISRFSDGCPVVEFETSFAQYALEIGDIITITNENYIYYGHDGITDSYTWEVVSKECNPSTGTIKFKVMFYGANTDPLTDEYITKSVRLAATEVAGDLVYCDSPTGMSISDVSGSALTGKISPGGINYNGYSRTPVLIDNDDHTFTASKDTYIYLDTVTGGMVFHETAVGAGTPTLSSRQKLLSKITTNSSGVTANVDLKNKRDGFSSRAFSGEARGQHGVYMETFETYNSNDWTFKAATSPTVTTVLPALSDQTGGRALSVTNYGWLESNINIPFDKSKLYRMRARVCMHTRDSHATDTYEKFYCGVAGIAADGYTYVNINGTNSYATQHYFVSNSSHVYADAGNALDVWVEYTGWFKGHAATGIGSESPDATNPAELHNDVRYFRPLIICNYNNGDGVMYIDYLVIDVHDEDAINRTYLGIAVNGNINSNMVIEGSIYNGSVTENKIGTGAVTENKIGALAVSSGKIASEAVTTAKVGANAIGTYQTVASNSGRNHNFDFNVWSRG